ncbi:IclR family transcriptional regulator [Amycolatopsis thermoflava]|uniref:IclR family transcriptional regulator n=1 Tax=Amycolatopsis thermoflava TaxID=84480 RepID=A0A3N2GRE7_9PSEU|nr:IclR family transcriptional regulator [Amycolatopsis thermoflava]ROS38485.1 IclR family transcriptional regulator [Amycolatopsis thermoflava]
MSDNRYYLAGVGRALRFLELIGDHENGLTLKQATDRLGLDTTSAFRLARTLETDGYLQRDEHGVYKLGSAALNLGVAYLDSLDLRRTSLPRLGALLEPPVDFASLAALSGRRAVIIERLERQAAAAIPGHAGWSFSLHSTSLGKALLAYLPVETAHEWLTSMPLPKLTPATLTTPDELQEELARIRADGCAYNIGESRPNALAVAAPVFNHLGHVVAAINASGYAPELTEDALRGPIRQKVLDAAAALSRDLGYRNSGMTTVGR